MECQRQLCSGSWRGWGTGLHDSGMDQHLWNERYNTREYVWNIEPNRFLPPVAQKLSPGRALDWACGEGRNAVWLASQGWKVTGIDFSDVGIEKGRRLAADQGVAVEWVVADVTKHDAQPKAYDLVVVMYLQLPPDDSAQAIQGAARAVAPGGTFLLVAHDLTNLDHGYGGPQDPSRLRTPETVAALLSGFEVVQAEVAERPGEQDGEAFVALDTFVLAERLTA